MGREEYILAHQCPHTMVKPADFLKYYSQTWWTVPVIGALEGQRQEDHCRLEVSLVYTVRQHLKTTTTKKKQPKEQMC